MRSRIDGLPQSTRDSIKTMHKAGYTIRAIHDWLLSCGFDHVTHGMTRNWCAKQFGVREPAVFIEPAETHEKRRRQYVTAVIDAGVPVYTLNRIRLRGPVWGQCTLVLKQAGIIESDNQNGGRYRLLVSIDELRKWRDEKMVTNYE